MKLKMVRLSEEYRQPLERMMEEWRASGEPLFPACLAKGDFRDFKAYADGLDQTDRSHGKAPSSVYFCLDADENRFVGAAEIRHYLNEEFLYAGGHILFGVLPQERNRGIGKETLSLSLKLCGEKYGVEWVLLTCPKDNFAATACITANGGVYENTVVYDGEEVLRFWIFLEGSKKKNAYSFLERFL